MDAPVIALMTDFGDDDFFVASLKGTILKINPDARLVDITHRVPSFDFRTASFILASCYRYFPEKTIFTVVVDPGVGSPRPVLLVETKHYFFVAPDNGVLTAVLDEEEVQQVRTVTNEAYFLPAVLYVDKFGNLITNIPESQIQELKERFKNIKLGLHIREHHISRYEESYSKVAPGELLFLIGSLGLVEIACREGSAAQRIKAVSGDPVKIRGTL